MKVLRAFVEGAKLDLLEPVVEACFAPTEADLESCRQLGRAMARHLAVG